LNARRRMTRVRNRFGGASFRSGGTVLPPPILSRSRTSPLSWWAAPVVAVVLATSEPAEACSVCFGDPNSLMAKGAVMGVVVLLGVVGCVLGGMAGTGIYWIRRGRRLAQEEHPASRGVR